jgi:hypothetical protein
MIRERAPMTLQEIRINQNRRPQYAVLQPFAETAREAGCHILAGDFRGNSQAQGSKPGGQFATEVRCPAGRQNEMERSDALYFDL